MKKIIKPFISWFRLGQRVNNLKIAYKLLPEVYTPAIESIAKSNNGKYLFPYYNKILTKRQLALFGDHGEVLIKYLKDDKISFIEQADSSERICVKLNNKKLQLIVENFENLKVVEEVFIDLLYDFDSVRKFVVCDVGMNIGASCLYFASFDNVEKVYGYEPFPETFRIAERNFGVNDFDLSQKIVPFNFGIGGNSETIEVPALEAGALGGSTTPHFLSKTNNVSGRKVKVQLRDISEIIADIKNEHLNSQIILKLDCEGAEYNIFERMSECNLFDSISIIMVEYHFNGNQIIKDLLTKNGYFVMSPSNNIDEFGMLYAVNLSN